MYSPGGGSGASMSVVLPQFKAGFCLSAKATFALKISADMIKILSNNTRSRKRNSPPPPLFFSVNTMALPP